MALVPSHDTIAKEQLLEKARESGFAKERARITLHALIEEKRLFVHYVKRYKTNDEVRVGRTAPMLIERPNL